MNYMRAWSLRERYEPLLLCAARRDEQRAARRRWSRPTASSATVLARTLKDRAAGRAEDLSTLARIFYSTEAADAKITTIKPPNEIAPKARYTAAILRDA